VKTITLGKLAQIIGGKILSGHPHQTVRSVNFNKPKQLERHQVYFISKKSKLPKQLAAIRRVKPLAVVLPPHVSSSMIPSGVGMIRVQEPFSAYWRLALWNWRQYPVRVIGITGSAGKSTTTAMVASILKKKWPMVTTRGNLNTYSFLPDYLVQLQSHHRLLLLEMGMKSLNNIRRQCQVVKPLVSAVTNVGEAHVGSLGGLDLVVRAKQEIIDGTRAGGTIFINADDTRSQKLKVRHFRGKVKTFGIRNPSDIRGSNIKFTPKGMRFDATIAGKRYPFFIPTYGIHNVYNALAAIGIGLSMNMSISDIQQGLARFQAPKMRLQLIRGRGGRLLINDAWNANPTAMIAGLNVLKSLGSKRPSIAVLGDMLELGSLTYPSHVRVGKHLSKLNISQLVTIGKHARIIAQTARKYGMDPRKIVICSTREQLVRHLLKTPPQSLIYFKASRKLHLEKVVKQLSATPKS
jgi:UDP-N-acetylmuramoyl-tripeptide--D-alanyl-D-alanine ligase